MVIRCVLVLVSTRLVHLNMSYIISWFWLQWFEASIAKFIVIPYQYGILYIDDSNTKQEYIQWWTENETEIVKVKNIDSIFPLYLSSLLMWHYIYSMLIGVGSVMIERVFATIFIHDYEKKDRLYIPLLLISFTHCLSIPFSYFMTNNKISFSVAFGLLFLAMIISILLYLFVWKVNSDLRKIMENSKSKKIFSLGKKFQIKENLRSIIMIRKIVYGATFFVFFAAIFLIFLIFKIIPFLNSILSHLVENIIYLNPMFLTCVIMYCSPVWHNEFWKFIPGFRNYKNTQISVISTNIDETNVYFNQLKKSWD